MDKSKLVNADKLVEFLEEETDLDTRHSTANRLFCPTCETLSENCKDMDDDHKMDWLPVKHWYFITETEAKHLEKKGEIVLSLEDLGVYFWGIE